MTEPSPPQEPGQDQPTAPLYPQPPGYEPPGDQQPPRGDAPPEYAPPEYAPPPGYPQAPEYQTPPEYQQATGTQPPPGYGRVSARTPGAWRNRPLRRSRPRLRAWARPACRLPRSCTAGSRARAGRSDGCGEQDGRSLDIETPPSRWLCSPPWPRPGGSATRSTGWSRPGNVSGRISTSRR